MDINTDIRTKTLEEQFAIACKYKENTKHGEKTKLLIVIKRSNVLYIEYDTTS